MSAIDSTKKHGLRIGPAQRARFLKALRDARTFAEAAALAGSTDRAFRRLRERDPAFARAVADAHEAGTDVIRAEIRRRAVEGVERPAVSGGRLVKDDDGRVVMLREFSDRLLELEAKRRDPSYRDKQQLEIGGRAEVTHVVKHDLSDLLERAEQAGLLTRGPRSSVHAEAADDAERPALLPARTDQAADDRAMRASLPPD